MRWLARGLACAALFGVMGCGAKTGLRMPDVGVLTDAMDIVDAPDLGDVCLPPSVPLMRRPAEVMFVIDRSNSMRWDLMGRDPGDLELSRWAILRNALRTALPPFEATVAMGATVFPGVLRPGAPVEEQCAGPRNIDLRPVRNNSQPIIQLFRTTQPGGGTPTFGGLQVTANFLRANTTRGVPQYMILATDGGPNCNRDLNTNICGCTSRDQNNQPNCAPNPADPMSMGNVWNCLDDGRTVGEIERIAAKGIPVFVIGIDDPTRPDLTDVLNRMSVAGGRPRMHAPGAGPDYYSVRRAEDLTAAFVTIQQTIAQCSFVLPGMPPGLDRLVVEVNGTDVARDESHVNGWDWTAREFGEVALYGAACAAVADMPAPRVIGRIPCQPN